MGKIIQIQKEIPYDKPRNIQIYLPRQYEKRKREHFPVLYMHDGQNLFFNETSYAGVSWGVRQTMEAAERKGFSGMIVVGIENAQDARIQEYSAFAIQEQNNTNAEFYGAHYLDWIVYDLKPYIDQTLRTLPGKETTFMAGSSAGANISFYAGIAHAEVFSKIGLFSPAIWLFRESELQRFLSACMQDEDGNRQNRFTDSTFFIQCGTEEGGRKKSFSQAYINATLWLAQALLAQGMHPDQLQIVIEHGLNHSERAWRKVFPRFFRFLIEA